MKASFTQRKGRGFNGWVALSLVGHLNTSVLHLSCQHNWLFGEIQDVSIKGKRTIL